MTHLTVQQLSAALDGALAGPSLELVVRHLAACHDCRDRQARLAKHDDALRRLLGQDPQDLFLDDLTRRAEEQVLAIARGMPAPVMSTSVPLIHEEDPYAAVEPPAAPPRPELGRAGELAKEAGWGRIGMKPTASTRAPESNPEDAQRLLEALESGNLDDFTELSAQGMQENSPIDGPTFDLPDWIKEHSKSKPVKRDGPREVPKLNLFFADLDDRAAGLTREAVDEVFRREGSIPAGDPPRPPSPNDPGIRPPLSLVPPPASSGIPHEHAAFAPPGWAPPAEPSPTFSPEVPSAQDGDGFDTGDWVRDDEAHDEAHDGPYAHDAAEYMDSRDVQQDSTPVPGNDGPYVSAPRDTWSASGYDPPGSPVNFEPFVLTTAAPRKVRREETNAAVVMALVSVGGLLLILLALQLAPAAPKHHKRGDGVLGARLPGVTLVRKDVPTDPPPASTSNVESASSQPPVDEAVLPATDAADNRDAPVSGPPNVISPDTAEEATAKPESETAQQSSPAAAPTTRARPARPVRAETLPVKPAVAPAASTTDDVSWPLLCGVVLDSAGVPLAGVRVTVTEIAFSVRTDKRGHFCLSAPAGTQHLLIEATGLPLIRQAVTLKPDADELRFQLPPGR